MKLLFAAASCLLTLLAFSHAQAQAQEVDDIDSQNGAQWTGWSSHAAATWLPGSTIRDTGGEVGMEEVKAGIVERFSINPRVKLSAGARYSLMEIDAPETARLPGSLQAVSVNLGAQYQATERVAIGVTVSPGLSGDLTSVDSKDVTVPVALHARGRLSDNLVLLGGIAYTGRNHAVRALPLLGLLYLPSQQWSISAGFPGTVVKYKPDGKTAYFVAGEFSRGEYHLDDRSVGANYLSYRDYRASAGAEIKVFSFAKVGVSGGYAFARKFAFYEGEREDIRLGNTPFARVDLKFSW